jgi:uncharacterized protein
MNIPNAIALVLVIVGGLNWLLVGLFEFDLVASLFGGQTAVLSKIVYVLVGLAAIWLLIRFPKLVAERPVVSHVNTSRDRNAPPTV